MTVFAASCANSSGSNPAFTPFGQCEVYEGLGETTEYTVELAFDEDDEIILGVQGFHPGETSPHRIIAITLSNGKRLRPERLSNECTCGVKFRRMEAICAFVSTYKVSLERDWIEEARNSGLSMQFELANGHATDGPPLTPKRIEKFLSRLD